MAKFDRFLIAPMSIGLETDLKPFLIPDEAFAQLDNAYVFRGRVRKRFGSRFMGYGWSSATEEPLFSRLRINMGNTAAGVLAGTVPGSIFSIGQQFSVGTDVLTAYINVGGPQVMLTTGTTTGTYDITTGAFTIANGPVGATPVWWYPGESVMGLTMYSQAATINNQPTYAFDPQFSYKFSGGFWQRTPSTTTAIWHDPSGNRLNFFWSTNWQGINQFPQIMWTTNFQVTNINGAGTVTDDPIWFYDGTTWTPAIGVNGYYFRPNPAGTALPKYTGAFVQTARLIVPYKNRLVLLNTIESSGTTAVVLPNTDGAGNAAGISAGGIIGQYFEINGTYFTIVNPTGALAVSGAGVGTGTYNTTTGAYTFAGAAAAQPINFYVTLGTLTNFSNRARFCHYGSPASVNAWYESGQNDASTPANVGDGGGYVDAATDEEIISCEFIKDYLIVYFERSTWALAYTGNAVQPFTWQKINTELGSESQFSTVSFDKEVLTIGSTGVHSCNGSNVERIDSKIPQEVFEISNKNIGVQRVAGIRDYYVECVYWTFPSNNENPVDTYPNRVLLYNYQNGSWAFNNDCITCFGYFEQQQGLTWAAANISWLSANFSWNSGTTTAEFRQVIAGNQQGYVFIVDAELNRNERAMSITNITYPAIGAAQLTIMNHTLEVGDYITIENTTGINLPITASYQVTSVVTDDIVNVYAPDVSGTYLGGGNSARVSRIEILSKQWNPYMNKDRNFYLQRIDFAVDKTQLGEITVDYFPSSTQVSMINAGGPSGTNAMVGNNVLETRPYDSNLAPLEQYQERLWHPVYFQTDGNCIQIYIYLSDAQLADLNIAWSDFEMNALILYTQATRNRME